MSADRIADAIRELNKAFTASGLDAPTGIVLGSVYDAGKLAALMTSQNRPYIVTTGDLRKFEISGTPIVWPGSPGGPK